MDYFLLAQTTEHLHTASLLELIGAGCFGALLGWNVYYINRHRKEKIKLADLATLLGVIGGGAVLALFPAGSRLFGAYGIGLAIGFFGYLVVLCCFVAASRKSGGNYGWDWFLVGHTKGSEPGDSGQTPMGNGEPGHTTPQTSQSTKNEEPSPGGSPMG